MASKWIWKRSFKIFFLVFFSRFPTNLTPTKSKTKSTEKVWRGQRSEKDCSNDTFIWTTTARPQQQPGDPDNVNENDAEAEKLFQQFRNVFGNEIGTNLYYALNSEDDSSDDVAHIRIEQMTAEINELTDSSDSTNSKTTTNNNSTTTTTMLSTASSDNIEQTACEEVILTSPTSSSSMYAIRSPSPPLQAYFKYPTHLKAPAQYHPSDSEEEGVTLTEIVEIHRVPSVAPILNDNNNYQNTTTTEDEDLDIESQVNNNNTSCSLSSNLTDSKTLDVRTPIVV